MPLDRTQLRAFGEQGYLLVPGLIPAPLVAEAKEAVRRLLSDRPPPAGQCGRHDYNLSPVPAGPLLAALMDSEAMALARALVRPGALEVPEMVQVALNIPWHTHHPGGPHIDGLTPPETSGRPGTFTLLAGIFLTDQPEMEMGNIWVWPGTHRTVGAHLRARGADALMDAAERYPPVELPPPVAVVGQAGDLLLANYLCGHNSSGNESQHIREVLTTACAGRATRNGGGSA